MSSSYPDYSAQSSSYSQEYQSYFVPGYGISRHIIFSHIQYYLGPYATVRPYQFRGREGFLVNAPGKPLTKVCSVIFKLLNRYASSMSFSYPHCVTVSIPFNLLFLGVAISTISTWKLEAFKLYFRPELDSTPGQYQKSLNLVPRGDQQPFSSRDRLGPSELELLTFSLVYANLPY